MYTDMENVYNRLCIVSMRVRVAPVLSRMLKLGSQATGIIKHMDVTSQ